MDGFVADYISAFTAETGRQPKYDEYAQIMTGYTPEQLPVISALARGFATFDHWFCEVPSQPAGKDLRRGPVIVAARDAIARGIAPALSLDDPKAPEDWPDVIARPVPRFDEALVPADASLSALGKALFFGCLALGKELGQAVPDIGKDADIKRGEAIATIDDLFGQPQRRRLCRSRPAAGRSNVPGRDRLGRPGPPRIDALRLPGGPIMPGLSAGNQERGLVRLLRAGQGAGSMVTDPVVVSAVMWCGEAGLRATLTRVAPTAARASTA